MALYRTIHCGARERTSSGKGTTNIVRHTQIVMNSHKLMRIDGDAHGVLQLSC